jgi:proteasome activator subunit 3 (PA28 gamma)
MSAIHFLYDDANSVCVDSHVLEQSSGKKRKYDNCVDSEREVPGTKVMALPSGTVPCNKHLCNVVGTVKPHIRQLIEDANLVINIFSPSF